MTYLNIKDEKLYPTVVELNVLLADYHMYYQNLRNFHWNILGENFFELHNKFEGLYNDAKIKIDEIAERILTLGYHPTSTYSDYLKISTIDEAESRLTDKEMVKCILTNHKILIEQFARVNEKAAKIKDEGTIDLIGAYIRELEKNSWMLNAFIKSTKTQLKETLS